MNTVNFCRVVCWALLLPLFPGAVVADVTSNVQVQGKTLRFSGIALRKQLSDDLYIAALHLEVLTEDPIVIANPSNTKRMEIRILADRVSAKRFGRLWAETIRINNDAVAVKNHEKEIIRFMDFFKESVVVGDQLVFEHIQGKGTTVILNQTVLGNIRSDMFMPLLVQTWIGPRPPSDTFKASILGINKENTQTIAQTFERQNPTTSRVAAIKQWIAKAPEKKPKVVKPKPKKTAARKSKPASSGKKATVKKERLITQPKVSKKQKEALARKKAQERRRIAAQKKLDEEKKIKEAVALALAKQKKELELKQAQELAKAQKANQESKGINNYLASRDYEQSLISWVTKKIVYPPNAYKRGLEGKGILKIQISRDGAVRQVMVDKSTSSRLLDKEAVKAVKQLSPLPAMPDELPGQQFEFLAPVTFKR